MVTAGEALLVGNFYTKPKPRTRDDGAERVEATRTTRATPRTTSMTATTTGTIRPRRLQKIA